MNFILLLFIYLFDSSDGTVAVPLIYLCDWTSIPEIHHAGMDLLGWYRGNALSSYPWRSGGARGLAIPTKSIS
jgi:hypothetical protein